MTSSTIDSGNPWLGLASFSEETQHYFYGREEEVGDLTRRIQRKLLTVLFGQSGLGKTSILRAGIVPRLRAQGYCPVYVRIDYGPTVPSASEQIKQGIISATADAGTWTRSGSARDQESLWEFLHHREDVLLDANGKPVIPLLIFDQFEEIFTLAQTDDTGRAHAAHFLAALAELVENRAPPELESRMEHDDDAAAEFDFARTDYRVLISLREDYLAHLEGLKAAMPSITQNRMRLAPMTGLQALSAVTGPGGKLVSGEVAEAIVRFVAGGAELANAQVEPSLLSLICRELNDKRIHAGRSEISLDLLAGSHASILSDFYERSLADHPAAVRQVIEDVLLTDSGYRENVAAERVLKALAAAGAAPDTLSVLVNRRLLRIEDRLDIRRVELTHDVLCSVVGASREQRREREQQAAAERELAAQLEREQATHRSLIKARKVMAGCVVLAGAAVGSAIFGYVKLKESQETRAIAEVSRDEAEKLIGFVVDDFFTSLTPIGRADLQLSLAERANTYYSNLPEHSRTLDSERNRGLALMRLGSSTRTRQGGDMVKGMQLSEQAVALLDSMSKANPGDERTELNLARTLTALATGHFAAGNFDKTSALIDRAVQVAAPYGAKADAPLANRLVYARALSYRGFSKLRSGDQKGAQADSEAVLRLAEVGGIHNTDDGMAMVFITASNHLHEAILFDGDGDIERAERVAAKAVALSQVTLRRSPQLASSINRTVKSFTSSQGIAEVERGFPGKALATFGGMGEQMKAAFRRDPTLRTTVDDLSIVNGFTGKALISLGRPSEAIDVLKSALAPYNTTPPMAFHAGNLVAYAAYLAEIQYEVGLDGDAAKSRAKVAELVRIIFGIPKGTGTWVPADLTQLAVQTQESLLAHHATDIDTSEREIAAYRKQFKALGAAAVPVAQRKAHAEALRLVKLSLGEFESVIAEKQSQHARVESLAREVVALQEKPVDALSFLPARNRQAKALVALGRHAEAKTVLDPMLTFLNMQMAKGSDSIMVRWNLVEALMTLSVADPQSAQANLKKSSALLEQMPAGANAMRSIIKLRSQLTVQMKKNGIAPSTQLLTASKPLQS